MSASLEADMGPSSTQELRSLSRSECLAFLRSRRRGRLAFTRGALPAVVPTGFTLEGNRLALSPSHPALLTGSAGQVVTLQCDGFDVRAGEIWSVSVTGVALLGSGDREGAGDRLQLRLEPELLTGWAERSAGTARGPLSAS